MNLNRIRQALGGVVLCGATLPFVYCSHSPLQPSATALPSQQIVSLLVRVMARPSTAPTALTNAIVTDGHQRTRTDAEGYARLPEVLHGALTITADADGYGPMSAWTDNLTGAETWTFYLEKR